MIYLINQEWTNTSKNHAGMKYLCANLQEKYPDKFRSISIRDYYVAIKKNRIARLFQHYYVIWQYKKCLEEIFKSLQQELKDGDTVIMMEYYEKLYPQLALAQNLSFLKADRNISVYAMIHLVPQGLSSAFNDDEFHYWSKPIDKYITLGTSLSKYLVRRGIDKSRIITSFHYVDVDYYHPIAKKTNEKIKVLAMGNQMRNTKLLQHIVLSNPDVDFIICQGVSDMSPYFKNCTNVTLIPFVPEDKLRYYMDQADISLNVMVDTVGSNVITTSLAMGLAMICSDVGSIRDYCDNTNTIFCDNADMSSWAIAIHSLVENRQKLARMKQSSLAKSKTLSIENFADSIMNGEDL